MLVAEKNYMYAYEQYAPDYYKEKEVKKAKTKKGKNKAASKMFKMVFNISIFFLIGFVILLRYASLTQITNTIDKQKKELINLEKTNSQLKAELAIDLDTVDEISKNKLGMDRPYKYQIVYVELQDNNTQEVNTNTPNKFNIVEQIESFVQYLY